MKTNHEIQLPTPLPPIPDEAEQRVARYQQEQLHMQQEVAAKYSERALERAEKGDNAIDAAGIIFDYYKSRPSEVANNIVAAATHDVDALVGAYRQRLEHKSNGDEAYMAKKEAVFRQFGLEPDQVKEIVSSWGSGYNGKKMAQDTAKGREMLDNYLGNIRHHLVQMLRIETHQPGAVRGLFEKYGIRHFARYHDRDLLRQLNGQHTGPVEVVLIAAEDHNLAFGPDQKTYASESASARGLGIEEPLFAEARDPLEAFSRLGQIKEDFGEITKVEAVAHGSKRAVHFGRGRLKAEDVRREKSFKRLIDEGVLSHDADIILGACYSQKLAQAISEQTSGKTIAPGRETSGVYFDSGADEYIHAPAKGHNMNVHVYEHGKRTNSRVRKLGRHVVNSFRRASPSL